VGDSLPQRTPSSKGIYSNRESGGKGYKGSRDWGGIIGTLEGTAIKELLLYRKENLMR